MAHIDEAHAVFLLRCIVSFLQALALCSYLDNNRQLVNLQGKTVLELGAGTGLVTIVASLLGEETLNKSENYNIAITITKVQEAGKESDTHD